MVLGVPTLAWVVFGLAIFGVASLMYVFGALVGRRVGNKDVHAGDPELSRMLWDAREIAEMYADVVEARMGRLDVHSRALVMRIDIYRQSRGWSPDGFGRED